MRERPFFFYAIAALLFVVPVFYSLALTARVLPVRDATTGEIVGTEPNPRFIRQRRLSWVLGTMGVIVTGIGVGVSISNRRSDAKAS